MHKSVVKATPLESSVSSPPYCCAIITDILATGMLSIATHTFSRSPLPRKNLSANPPRIGRISSLTAENIHSFTSVKNERTSMLASVAPITIMPRGAVRLLR